MNTAVSLSEIFNSRLRGYLRQQPIDESKLRQAEEWLIEETSTYISRKYVSFLVKSKLWRETRAEEVLSEWIANGHLNYNLLALFFRQLRAHHCNDLLRRLASEAGKAYPFSPVHMHVCLPPSSRGSDDEALSESDLETCRQFVSAPRSEVQWRFLAKFNPLAAQKLLSSFQLNAEQLRASGRFCDATDESLHLPSLKVVNNVYNEILRAASETGDRRWIHEIFEDVKRYLDSQRQYDKWDYRVLMEVCPRECVEWGRSLGTLCGEYKEQVHSCHMIWHWTGPMRQRLTLPEPFKATISRTKARHLPRHLLYAIAKDDLAFAHYLPMSDQRLLWEELSPHLRSSSNEGILPPTFLSHFPIPMREGEALKAIEAPPVQSDDYLLFQYIRLLSLEKAMPFLYRQFRNPDFEVRERVYEAFGALTVAQKVDPDPFLELCEKCVNDRDPVRGYLYQALSTLDFAKFSETHLDRVHSLLTVTANQIDMSYETSEYVQGVINKFFLRRPVEALNLQAKFNTHEQFAGQCPRVECHLMSDECLRLLDNWIASRKKTNVMQMVDSLIYTSSIKQLRLLPKTCEHFMSQKEFNMFSTHGRNLPKVLKSWKTFFPETYNLRMRKIVDSSIGVLEDRYFCQWAVINYPQKITEYFGSAMRKRWLGNYSTPLLMSLSREDQTTFARYCRDLLMITMTRHVSHSHPLHLYTGILHQLHLLISLDPRFYLHLMDKYRELYVANKEDNADESWRKVTAEVPGMLLISLSTFDDAWKASQAILEKLENNPEHPSRVILPDIIARLPPRLQSRLLKQYQSCMDRISGAKKDEIDARNVRCDDKSMLTESADPTETIDSDKGQSIWNKIYGEELLTLRNRDLYWSLVSNCVNTVPERQSLKEEVLSKLTAGTAQDILSSSHFLSDSKRFWDELVFKMFRELPEDGDLRLLRSLLRISPRSVRLAGRTKAVQDWLSSLAESDRLDYRLLGQLIKLATKRNFTILNIDWFYSRIPHFLVKLRQWSAYERALEEAASAVLAQTSKENGSSTLSPEESRAISKEQRSQKCQAVESALLDILCRLALERSDDAVCLQVAQEGDEDSFDRLRRAYVAAGWPKEFNDKVFGGLFNYLRTSMKSDSLRLQATVLQGFKSATTLHQIFRDKLFDLDQGLLVWLADVPSFLCDTTELGLLLSDDYEPSHRYLAYKLLTTSTKPNDPKVKEAITQLTTSFQYNFV